MLFATVMYVFILRKCTIGFHMHETVSIDCFPGLCKCTPPLITELSQWPCGNRNPQPEPPLSSSSGPPPFRFIVLMNPSIFPCLSVHHSLIFFIFHSFMERKVKRDRKVCWRRAGMTPCVVLQVRVSPGLFLNWSTYALSPHHFVVWSEIWDDQSVSLHNAQPITHNAP